MTRGGSVLDERPLDIEKQLTEHGERFQAVDA